MKAKPAQRPQDRAAIEVILKRQILAAKKKSDAGKTLSVREEAQLRQYFAAGQKITDEMIAGPQRQRGVHNAGDMVDTLGLAASRLNAPLPVIRLAKKMGCSAFRASNRISISELRKFIDSEEFKIAVGNGDVDTMPASEWDKRLKRAKALREEFRLRKEKGESWDSEHVRRAYAVGDEAIISTLRRWLESDQPPLIEGKSAAQILAANRRFMDELVAELQSSRDAAVAQLADAIPEAEAENE